jgi:hypothetical protein
MTDTADPKTASTAIAGTPKAPLIKLSRGAEMARVDPAILEAAISEKRDQLLMLADDTAMPDNLRQVVRNLVALSAPNKPGLEEMAGSWNIPRINIAQPTSRSEAKPESAKNGSLYTTEGKLLDMPWGGIPIHFSEENINFPKGGGNNPVCQSPDSKLGSPFGVCEKCPNVPFGKQNGGRGDQKHSDCYSNIVVVMLATDLSQVYKVQFGKTSRKAGAALLALARQQPFVWKQSYVLTTEKKTNDMGMYWIFQTQPTGKDNDPNVLKLCEKLYGLWSAERDRFLADWYARPARAPMVAAEAEGSFEGGALDAGLGDGVEPDLSTPASAAATTKSSGATTKSSGARTSPKPM